MEGHWTCAFDLRLVAPLRLLDCLYPRDLLGMRHFSSVWFLGGFVLCFVWFCCFGFVFVLNCLIPFSSHKSCGVFQVSVEGHWTYSWTYVLVLRVSLRLFNLDCRYPRDLLQPARKKKCLYPRDLLQPSRGKKNSLQRTHRSILEHSYLSPIVALAALHVNLAIDSCLNCDLQQKPNCTIDQQIIPDDFFFTLIS